LQAAPAGSVRAPCGVPGGFAVYNVCRKQRSGMDMDFNGLVVLPAVMWPGYEKRHREDETTAHGAGCLLLKNSVLLS